MRTKQATTLLTASIKSGRPVLLTGAPGVGKTDIVRQAAAACDNDIVISYLSMLGPQDAIGIPWPNNETGSANFLPIGECARVLRSDKPTVWFWDDVGQAPPATQAAFMQWLLGRGVGEYKLPDHVTIVAATNRKQDKAGVTAILEPVKSRFAAIVNVDPHLEDWCEWALTHGVRPEIIAFLRHFNQIGGRNEKGENIDMLCSGVAGSGMESSPSPRTWNNLSRLLDLGLPKDMEMEVYSGAVGAGAAAAFMGFMSIFRSMVSIDEYLIKPTTAKLPENLSEKFGVATGLGARCTLNNFGSIAIVLNRMHEAGMGEFAVICIQDCIRACNDLVVAPEWAEWCFSPSGRALLGSSS